MFIVRHPRSSNIVTPLLSLEVATPARKSINSTLSSICKKSASKAILGRMQLILHATRRTPHGALRLVLAMSAWSVRTRRSPSLYCRDGSMVIRLRPCMTISTPPPSQHCRDARVYGYTTTAMHDMSTPSPPPLSPGT